VELQRLLYNTENLRKTRSEGAAMVTEQ